VVKLGAPKTPRACASRLRLVGPTAQRGFRRIRCGVRKCTLHIAARRDHDWRQHSRDRDVLVVDEVGFVHAADERSAPETQAATIAKGQKSPSNAGWFIRRSIATASTALGNQTSATVSGCRRAARRSKRASTQLAAIATAQTLSLRVNRTADPACTLTLA